MTLGYLRSRKFSGAEHGRQCKRAFGNDYSSLHRLMDQKVGGGSRHRLHGHTAAFFRRLKGGQREAAIIHLLGDFSQDLIREVLPEVLNRMTKDGISPPFVVRTDATGTAVDWNLTKKARKQIRSAWVDGLTDGLRLRRKR